MKPRHGYTNKPGDCAKCGKALPVPRPDAEKLCSECDPNKRKNAEIVKLVDQGLSNADVGARLSLPASAIAGRLNRMGKTRPFPKITAAQLKRCRLDPVWEVRPENRGIVPTDRIVCRECGEARCDLNCSGGKSHLLRDHHMTPNAYRRKYPGARTTAFDSTFASCAGAKTLDGWLDEFAALYLTPAELAKCRKDPAWEAHHGITEFVVCRCCGLKKKFAISGHTKSGHLITQHGLTFAAYRSLFPKAPQMPEVERAGRRQRHSAWAKSRFKLAREAARSPSALPSPVKRPAHRPRDPETTKKIKQMAEMMRLRLSTAQMALKLFPEQSHTPKAAQANVRQLKSRLKAELEAELLRLQGVN